MGLKQRCQRLQNIMFHSFQVKREAWQRHEQNLTQSSKHALRIFIKKHRIILNKMCLILNKVVARENRNKKEENRNCFYPKKGLIKIKAN